MSRSDRGLRVNTRSSRRKEQALAPLRPSERSVPAGERGGGLAARDVRHWSGYYRGASSRLRSQEDASPLLMGGRSQRSAFPGPLVSVTEVQLPAAERRCITARRLNHLKQRQGLSGAREGRAFTKGHTTLFDVVLLNPTRTLGIFSPHQIVVGKERK